MGNPILEFINKRFKDTIESCNWLNGNCYYFAVILKDRFPESRIVYDPILGHFMIENKGVFYDARGIAYPEVYYDWKELKDVEPQLYSRITKDCIW